MKSVKVALCGIGGYGASYVKMLLNKGREHNVIFSAAVDPFPERCPMLEEIRTGSIPVFKSLEEMAASHVPDLVVISSPIHFHAPQTLQALSLGASVLCEKPIAASVEDVATMESAAKRTGKVVAIGYQWSFTKAVQTMKADILDGRFGRPIRLKTLALWPRNRKYYERSSWAGRIRTPSGEPVLDSPVNNATAHYLHNMLYVLGDTRASSAVPISVDAELYRANKIENYDTGALRIRLENDAEILFFSTHAAPETVGPIACYEFEKATICFQCRAGNTFHAITHAGESIVYGSPDAELDSKLWETIEAVRSGATSSLCGIVAAGMHTLCVTAAQQAKITEFPASSILEKEEKESTLTVVPGLDGTFVQCYNMNRLPSELKTIPWAKPFETHACSRIS
jgi:predicted dehydrogenase